MEFLAYAIGIFGLVVFLYFTWIDTKPLHQ